MSRHSVLLAVVWSGVALLVVWTGRFVDQVVALPVLVLPLLADGLGRTPAWSRWASGAWPSASRTTPGSSAP